VRRAGKRLPMPRLLELVSLHQPAGIVVGLPLAADGSEEESASAAREMAATIARRTGLPLELWDERMSTARALAAIWEQGGSTRGRKAEVDALAASVVLQHFLDARKNSTRSAERMEAEAAEMTETEKTERTERESTGW
jgi:putative holliday junction resolvase